MNLISRLVPVNASRSSISTLKLPDTINGVTNIFNPTGPRRSAKYSLIIILTDCVLDSSAVQITNVSLNSY